MTRKNSKRKHILCCFFFFPRQTRKKTPIIAMSSSISFYSTDFLLFQLKKHIIEAKCVAMDCIVFSSTFYDSSYHSYSLWDFSSCGMLFCIVWKVIWDEWWTWMIVWNVIIPLMLLCAVRLLNALLEGFEMNMVEIFASYIFCSNKTCFYQALAYFRKQVIKIWINWYCVCNFLSEPPLHTQKKSENFLIFNQQTPHSKCKINI